jgi:hypothetical protein
MVGVIRTVLVLFNCVPHTCDPATHTFPSQHHKNTTHIRRTQVRPSYERSAPCHSADLLRRESDAIANVAAGQSEPLRDRTRVEGSEVLTFDADKLTCAVIK